MILNIISVNEKAAGIMGRSQHGLNTTPSAFHCFVQSVSQNFAVFSDTHKHSQVVVTPASSLQFTTCFLLILCQILIHILADWGLLCSTIYFVNVMFSSLQQSLKAMLSGSKFLIPSSVYCVSSLNFFHLLPSSPLMIDWGNSWEK